MILDIVGNQPINVENSPDKSERLGPMSEQVKSWVEARSATFLDMFSKISLSKLGGLGWQEITLNDAQGDGLCKFDFGNGIYPLNTDEAEAEADIVNGKIKFTGARLCGYATYIMGKVLEDLYPTASLSWINASADMRERLNVEPMGKDHKLLEVAFPEEVPFLIDLTYGQVVNNRQVLIVPSKDIDRWYKSSTSNAIETNKISFSRASEFVEEECDLPREDLEILIRSFIANNDHNSVILTQKEETMNNINLPESQVNVPLPTREPEVLPPVTIPEPTPETPIKPVVIPEEAPSENPAEAPITPNLPDNDPLVTPAKPQPLEMPRDSV